MGCCPFKTLGGKWNRKEKLLEPSYKNVKVLGLEGRIKNDSLGGGKQ